MTADTPLMKQYNAIKGKHPDALLLFRVGDFYETFGEDAVKSSKILGITLTKRNNGTASEIALAGFPYHALDNYLPKLVRAGLRVAICDQLEDPKMVKGIVKRGVTELVTPGIAYNDNVLESKQNNYLAAIHIESDNFGIAFLDVSTGEFLLTEGKADYADKLLQNFQPSEILLSKTARNSFAQHFTENKYTTFYLDDWVFTGDYAYEKLTSHFNTASLKGFGVEAYKSGIVAAGAILHYLHETEHKNINHIVSLARIEEEKYVWLDRFTTRNLELLYPQHPEGVPLFDVINATLTPMGARLLRKWITMPLKELSPIQERLNIVEAFLKEEAHTFAVRQHLKSIGDVERLISKVAARRVNPREMLQLRKSLEFIMPLKQILSNYNSEPLKKYADQLNPCDYLLNKITTELRNDPPLTTNQGGLINDGVNAELDTLRKIAYSGKDYLLQIQQREVERTGINSLKIAYNKVFGYYLEVTHVHKNKVPPDWIRKQTLANAERYVTEELKKYEEEILTAEEKINLIEQKIFNDLVLSAEEYVGQILQNARVIALVDCLSSFAHIAREKNYCKPEINESKKIDIKKGRHPVIEQQLPVGESYVPNDIYLDNETQQIIIITGPNMAGKSALLRQTALIVLMAQIGCYVPAESASIGVVDKIFTRVGASDNLSRGESTFMVEMTETASILNNLSDRSLVLMDEIGRGTSTYDGVSIAWAIVEHLHNHPRYKAKTLFATHYHELNQLAERYERIKNYNVSVKEIDNKIIFLRTLKEGGSEHSFGIHVAQMAGMPNSVVLRANEILNMLEKTKHTQNIKSNHTDKPVYQLSIFEANDPNYLKVKDILKNIDINTISPVEALLKLNEIKTILGS
ncbi:MAG: DNA mismatch repair protein MutS [Cytophagaceae bacterium]|nr:DNA mismatch repair protein MutS [Cytophagaceae bacterium]MDW8455468.1 DNA mismatch repair protein MutS [Cytophagaceae bacterium]